MGSKLLATGEDSNLYIWDIQNVKKGGKGICIGKFPVHGGGHIESIANYSGSVGLTNFNVDTYEDYKYLFQNDSKNLEMDEKETKTIDLGCMGFTALGSDSGVVNIYSNYILYNWQNKKLYSNPTLIRRPPYPIKEIMNLTTAVQLMTFNHDGQILSIASKDKKDAVKCVHIP